MTEPLVKARTTENCREGGHLWVKMNSNQQVCTCGTKRWVDRHGNALRYECSPGDVK